MKLLAEQLQKVLGLSPAERVILAQAWGLLFIADLALRVLPFKRLVALTQPRPLEGSPIFPRPHSFAPSPPPSPWKGEGDASLSASRLAWLVEVAGRYTLVNATCLKKALVLSWILGRKGVATTLRIGVRRHEGTLRGHAWLERQGQVLVGQEEMDQHEPLLPAPDLTEAAMR